MKITPLHYAQLKEQIEESIECAITDNPHASTLKEFFAIFEEQYAEHTERRKVWDLYWKSGGADWIKEHNEGNPYAYRQYNDDHYTTALKKIYKELYTK